MIPAHAHTVVLEVNEVFTLAFRSFRELTSVAGLVT